MHFHDMYDKRFPAEVGRYGCKIYILLVLKGSRFFVGKVGTHESVHI